MLYIYEGEGRGKGKGRRRERRGRGREMLPAPKCVQNVKVRMQEGEEEGKRERETEGCIGMVREGQEEVVCVACPCSTPKFKCVKCSRVGRRRKFLKSREKKEGRWKKEERRRVKYHVPPIYERINSLTGRHSPNFPSFP